MIINIHFNPDPVENQGPEERFDTLPSPSGTIATLLNIEEELGYHDIIGIDEAFPGTAKTRKKITELINNDINNGNVPALLFTLLLYNAERTLKYIGELKKRFGKNIKIIVGGQLVPLARNAYLNNENIDAVCVGDAEEILPELLKDLSAEDLKEEYEGWVANRKVKKFSGVSYEHFWKIRERMKAQKEEFGFSQLTIQGPGGPGCAWASCNKAPCSFCALQNITVPNETPLEEYLKNEKELEEQFHPDRLFDAANQFVPTLEPRKRITWLERYIEIRKSYNIKAKKYAYLTVSSIDDKVAKLLKMAGIAEIYLGIDHFNEDALKQEGKSFHSMKVIKRCLDALKNEGINFRAGIVLGSAKESVETLESVRRGIEWLTVNYKEILKAVGIFPIEILPGSKDFKDMHESGICPELFQKFFRYGYLSRSEQRRLSREWINHHSAVSAEQVYDFRDEIAAYLKEKGLIGYSVDRIDEVNKEKDFLFRELETHFK